MDNNIKIIIKLENENSSLKQTCEKMCKQNGETKAQYYIIILYYIKGYYKINLFYLILFLELKLTTKDLKMNTRCKLKI